MTAWVGRYSIVSGQIREHGPWLVDRVRRGEDQELRVIVLAEPVDARSADFCHEVAEAVAVLFARESLSITGGLLRALRQAHANLAEWNRRSLREHRVSVGVTCAVIRDGREVLLAQVGPGVAYSRHGETVARFSTEGLPAASPLGAAEPIEPLFTSFSLADSQLLVLTENADAALGRHTIENALTEGPEHTLAVLFPHTRNLTDMTAVLVADLDIDEEQAAAPLDFDDGIEETEGREVAFTGMEEPPAPPRVSRPRGWRVLGGRADGPPLPGIRSTRTVGGGNAPPPLVPWRIAAIVAVVAIALAVLAWQLLPVVLSEDRAAEVDAALSQAEAQFAVAGAANTADAEREALRAALARLEQARSLSPDDPRIRALEASVQAQLQALDAVTNVAELEGVIAFEGLLTAPVQPEQLVIAGGEFWLRESGRGRVVRLDPSGATDPQEVFRAGETYGDLVARDPAAIAWDASTGRMLIVDAGRALFAVTADGERATPLPLRDAGEMRSVTAIAVYLGNLYILDPVAGEIWRYLPAADGFDSERTGILGGVDLEGATALAVDGEVFVLDPPALRHFVQAREQEPMFQGIDEPPGAAVGLVEDVLREILYVADRGGGRIIATERTGEFLRQYRHPDFIDLRGVAVAPDGTSLYALTTDGISTFSLQPPRQ